MKIREWTGLGIAGALVGLGIWMWHGDDAAEETRERNVPKARRATAEGTSAHPLKEDGAPKEDVAVKNLPEWTPGSDVRPPNVPEGEAFKPGRPKVHNVRRYVRNADAIHRNAVEQTMVEFFTCEVGDLPPLMPDELPAEEMARLGEILSSPNPVTEEDSEEVRVGKETLELAKAELKKYLADGGDVQSFFAYYHGVLERAFEKRRLATEEVYRMIDEDPVMAKELKKRINRQLREEGIAPLPIPDVLFKTDGE